MGDLLIETQNRTKSIMKINKIPYDIENGGIDCELTGVQMLNGVVHALRSYNKTQQQSYILSAISVLMYKLTNGNTFLFDFIDKDAHNNQIKKIKSIINGNTFFSEIVNQTSRLINENYGEQNSESCELKVVWSSEEFIGLNNISSYKTVIYISRKNKKLCIRCVFDKSNYSYNYIRYLLENIMFILKHRLFIYDIRVKEIEVRKGYNKANKIDKSSIQPVIDIIDKVCTDNEKQIALKNDNKCITYGELKVKTDFIAQNLLEKKFDNSLSIAVIGETSIEFILVVLGILKAGLTYVPISIDNPENRIKDIVKCSGCEYCVCLDGSSDLEYGDTKSLSMSELLMFRTIKDLDIKRSMQSILYTIYTSGSTGNPKGVQITYENLSNYLLWAKEEYCNDILPVMPFFTSIGVDLTVTSLFLPLVCGGICKVHYSPNNIEKLAYVSLDDEINIIKMTPSQLKILNSFSVHNIEAKKIILGGEALTNFLINKTWNQFNRNLIIYNEYGPTEATVGCMCYRCEYGKEDRLNVSLGDAISNCNVYVLDKDENCVPEYGIGELYIGGLCLSPGYIGNEELNQKAFIKNVLKNGDRLYKTGDMVKCLPDNRLEYLGRTDDQIKVRGMRIETSEIKKAILNQNGVKDVVLKVDDKNECIIAVIESGRKYHKEKELTENLYTLLPRYMIPNRIVFTENLSLNNTGKLDLDLIDRLIDDDRKETVQVMPNNETERVLFDIWVEVLEHDNFGTEDSFFLKGGHSLSIATIAGKVYKEFNVMLELSRLFEAKTIKMQAELINRANVNEKYILKKAEMKKYYDCSYSQRRMYIFDELNKGSILYNTPTVFIVDGVIDIELTQESVSKIIHRQQSLRTSFEYIEGKIKQVVNELKPFKVDEFKIITGEENELINEYVRPFNLQEGQLIRVGVAKYKDKDNKYLLILDMHHIITDGLSMYIFVDEFCKFYNGYKPSELEVQYTDYSEWQHKLINSNYYDNQLKYWKDVYSTMPSELILPVDYKRETYGLEGKVVSFSIHEENTKLIAEFCRKHEVTMHMFLLCIFTIVVSKWSGSKDIVIGTSTSGRIHEELNNIIGVFINMIPIRLKPEQNKRIIDYLKEVKQSTIKGFENSELPIDMIRNLLPKMNEHNLLDITFTTQDFGNVEVNDYNINGMYFSAYETEYNICHAKLNITIPKTNPNLDIFIEYSSERFREDTISTLFSEYKRAIFNTIKNPYNKIESI